MKLLLMLIILVKFTFSQKIVDLNKIRLSDLCFKDLNKIFVEGKFDKLSKTWSNLQNIPSHGNSFDFGKIKDCMTFNHSNFQPKYCLIQYRYLPEFQYKVIPVPPTKILLIPMDKLDTSFGGAICIPNSCNSSDIKNLMTETFTGTELMFSDNYEIEDFCQERNTKINSSGIYYFSTYFHIFIITVVILGSITSNSNSSSFLMKFCQCFSLQRNLKSLLNTENSKRSTIPFLNGIKVILMCYIFAGHGLEVRFLFPVKSGQTLLSYQGYGNIFYRFFSVAISMDAFFIMCGLFIGRSLMKSDNFNFWRFCIERYFRLTFVLAAVLLSQWQFESISDFKFLQTPLLLPIYKEINKNCEKSLLPTLLHIQNLVEPNVMCAIHAWFIPVLFQLIVLSGILHLIVKKLRINEIDFYGFILIIGFALRLKTFLSMESYFDGNISSIMSGGDVMVISYFSTHIRVISFFSGILLSYILDRKFENSLMKNEKFINFMLYITIIPMFVYPFVHPMDRNLEIFYSFFYIFAVNFIIFACYRGFGGIINQFLSSNMFIVPSRVILSFTLCLPLIQGFRTLLELEAFDVFTPFDMVKTLVIDLIVSIIPVLFVYLMYESPIANLRALFINNEKKKLRKLK
ncbi:hypothetical protein PVAND_000297 [Polypedilum vanderplanki]|uniref:Nose resistant-to-fluoxetine protein N-terminal domain-containing protein n=1 Tax=Polypedilum vanderplanki TaxID=319348 RepID=A0A9J6BJW2_POLVA|nr:hypothetical protein PVAND_000297 [Polypedilum vanderplanki]